MTHHPSDQLPTLSTAELATTIGGVDIAGIGSQIGSFFGEKGAALGGQIGGLVQNLIGQFRGGNGAQ